MRTSPWGELRRHIAAHERRCAAECEWLEAVVPKIQAAASVLARDLAAACEPDQAQGQAEDDCRA
ncbi:hypothetical protein GCM10010394_54050 [Streptomyces crystallinus]|uniref:Uncharacterized protein n=1 Tax=Streptomyces crystallinus TaxID=68191 RepID=A0ABN1GR68_9ACTN